MNSTPDLPGTPSTNRRTRQSGTARTELLQHLLATANITDWDLLLVGDGSGTGWNEPNGWACVLIDRQTRLRKTLFGASSAGSVNFAELMPYFQALTWFHSQFGKQRLEARSPQRVHVLTDSQVTALHGNRAANPREELPDLPQRPLWAAVREQCRMGYQLQFHWLARMQAGHNWLCDLIAGLARQTLIHVGDTAPPPELLSQAQTAISGLVCKDPHTGQPLNVYEINPDG